MQPAGKRIVIVGVTGMVGARALDLALEEEEVAAVTVVARRPVDVSHPKLTTVIHEDFSDCAALASVLAHQDAALWCVGVYAGAVNDDEFRRITIDYTIEFARTLRAASPQAVLCFLSGSGTDQTEQSRMAFARYKGAAENALLDMGFPGLYLFRPGYIYPVIRRKEPNLAYTVARLVYPVVWMIMPNSVITSRELAHAMLVVALHGHASRQPILENRVIRQIAGVAEKEK